MAYEQKDMTGSLFKNDKKEQPNHPDSRGSATIDGVEYWVSGWTKEGKTGKWLSLSFKAKDRQESRSAGSKQPARPSDDEDIPF